ncbi:MAG: hypothetical protein AB8I08_08405 [Sandaracinaceae bacterium]
MRTLRELAGWGVLLSLWVIPPMAATFGVLWLSEDLHIAWPALGLVLTLMWPGLRQMGRAWRTPPHDEHAEADGRRPVLLIHRSADHELPWYRRLLALQRGHWRAARDQAWREALAAGYAPLGPALPLARPALPPASGPAAMLQPDRAWGPALRRRLKTARLAVIVLDATGTCADDIALALEVLGPRRTVLVMPATIESDLVAAWPALQAVVPGLPAFTSHALAFRFDPQGAVLAMTDPRGFRPRRKQLSQPNRMLLSHEHDTPPSPPSWSLFAIALPTLAGFVSTLAVPLLLDFEGADLNSRLLTFGGVAAVVLGVTLSVMGRRQFRLVTSNEAPFVVVASLPWLLSTVAPWMTGEWSRNVYSLDSWLRFMTAGAAFSAPLLLATSLMLSASALARRSPNRNLSYALFGIVALLPFATLVTLLDDSGTYVLGLVQFSLAGGIAASVAVVAASGDSLRPHQPTPLGAGASAALAVGAWATVVTTEQWRTLLNLDGPPETIRRLASVAPSLVTFDSAWMWFLLTVPLLVGLIASLHHGRGSRTAVGNVWALAPMIVVFGLVGTAHAGARTAFSHAYVQAGGLMLVRAMPARESASVTLAALGSGWRSTRPLDAVLTPDATFVGGALVPDSEHARRRLPARVPEGRTARIGADRATPARDVERLVAAFNADGRNCALSDLDGWTVPVRGAPAQVPRSRVLVILQLARGRYTLASTDGTNRQVDRLNAVSDLLDERRMLEPSNRTLFIQSDGSTDASTLLHAVRRAHLSGYTDLIVGVPPGLW